MLVTLFEIIIALLAVYGLRFLILNLTYIFLCKNKAKMCVAYFVDMDTDINQQIILNEKLIMGRSRAIILVDCNLDGDMLREIGENNPNVEIFRTERIMKTDGEVYG